MSTNFPYPDETIMIVQIYEVQTPEEAVSMAALGVDHIGSVVVSKDTWQQPLIRETIRTATAEKARSSLILLYNDMDLVLRSIDYYRPDIIHFCEMLAFGENDSAVEKTCALYLELQAAVKKRFPETAIMRSIPIPFAVNEGAPAGMIGTDGIDAQQGNDAIKAFKAVKAEKAVKTAPGGKPLKADAARAGVRFLARLFATVSDYFLTDTLLIGQNGAMEQPVNGFVGITGRTCDWDVAAELVRTSPIPVILAGGLSPENVYPGIRAVRPAGVDSCTLTNAVDESGQPIRFRKDAGKVRRFVEEARRR
jgi:phosphoribosylanthranilate isomerase